VHECCRIGSRVPICEVTFLISRGSIRYIKSHSRKRVCDITDQSLWFWIELYQVILPAFPLSTTDARHAHIEFKWFSHWTLTSSRHSKRSETTLPDYSLSLAFNQSVQALLRVAAIIRGSAMTVILFSGALQSPWGTLTGMTGESGFLCTFTQLYWGFAGSPWPYIYPGVFRA